MVGYVLEVTYCDFLYVYVLSCDDSTPYFDELFYCVHIPYSTDIYSHGFTRYYSKKYIKLITNIFC